MITGECDEDYTAEWNRASDLAHRAACSNAYRIIRAQGRGDKAARLIQEARALIARQH